MKTLFASFLICFFVPLFSVPAQVTQVTTTEGITLNFALPELAQEDVTFNGITYQQAQYADCGFTMELGNPKVPVTRVMLGVPLGVAIQVGNVSASSVRTVTGVRLPPVPVRGVWQENGNAYRQREPYPAPPLARIVQDGMLRSQRVVVVELTPVQYLPQARQLRTYSRLTAHLQFQQIENVEKDNVFFGLRKDTTSQRITYPNAMRTTKKRMTEESDAYENALSQLLLNAAAARRFRAPRMQGIAPAGAAPAGIPSLPTQHRYKISIADTGIYRLTGETLLNTFGIELIGADPGTFQLWHGTREVPIFISGASDSKFDAGDAIFFLGNQTQNPYTPWNVYWLTVASLPKERWIARVPLRNASPGDATATQVPTFRSTVTFEEDKLTSNLEFLKPDAVTGGDKHAWFDSLDFWYWDGIKNGSDSGEMRLEFPLYDIAKSFEPPYISVDLQGGTPVNHEILVAINGVRIDFAQWEMQDTLTVQRMLRAWDTFKDQGTGASNILSLVRVDDTFEEDTRRYPYHVYVNRFSVEYTRLFRAVYDELTFSSKGSAEENAEENQRRSGRKLQYKIQDFFNPNVHVFETDGVHLTAKMGGVAIEATPLSPAARQRWKHLANQENSSPRQRQGRITQKNVQQPTTYAERLANDRNTYTATFQVPDTPQRQFIAVSESALRLPTRIEMVQPSDLLSTTQGADYIVIAHAMFQEAAQRLADWRAQPTGGGHRTKVVSTDEVYNTFGDGSVHPEAIKAFLTHAYHHWTPPAPTYVVLFGDGSFDFRGINTEVHPEPPERMGYIPTHYIHTDSFGRTASDHWYATLSGHDEFTDVYIGRISVEDIREADAVVDKIIAYEQRRPNGAWRRRIISVADDEISNSGDFIFKKSLNEIAKNHTLLGYQTVEVFLEDVIDEVEARPADFPNLLPQRVAKNRIIDALSEGAVIAQYAGHGGRVVWAHEAIFDNLSIDKLEETSHTPFMLVLSCYNGYFDEPGEPSMAEKLLRKERGGIIGMLSATRLTYAGGNDALNRIIFNMIFKRNVRQLGPLSFDSKVELLLTEGTGQIDVMMEYMLFGDPALQIATPAYEIRPKIETKTVAPGDTLRVAPGIIESVQYDAAAQTKRFTPHPAFNGKLTVTALFPGKTAIGQGAAGPVEYYTGDVIVTQTLQVTGGAFPGVNIAVPQNIAAGDAHVEYYAENAESLAVGGDGFTVNVPKILDIVPELVAPESFRVSVQVSDDKTQLASVILEWRNPKTRLWEQVALVPREGEEGWWTVPELLPAPTDGTAIRYEIQVTDTEAHTATTDILRYYPYRTPNLSVVTASNNDVVRYGYDSVKQQWLLSADVQCEGEPSLTPVTPVTVVFFSGTPDKDEDSQIDADAVPLGTARIAPSDWVQRTPLARESSTPQAGQVPEVYAEDVLNTHPIATVTLAYELPFGTHDIFVGVDSTATVQENDEEDNIGYRRIRHDSMLIGPQPVQIRSLDGNARLTAPPNALASPTVVALRPIHSVTQTVENDNVVFGLRRETNAHASSTAERLANDKKPEGRLPLPGRAIAYQILIVENTENRKEENDNVDLTDASYPEHPGYLVNPAPERIATDQKVTIDLGLDTAALRQQLIIELLGGEEAPQDGQELMLSTHAVAEAVVTHVRETGVYLRYTSSNHWTRLESVPLTDASGNLIERIQVTDVSETNLGEGGIRDVRIHPDGARVGKWVLFFTGPRTYRLLHAPTDSELPETENVALDNVEDGLRKETSAHQPSSPNASRMTEIETVATSQTLSPFNPSYLTFTAGLSLHIEPEDEKPFAFGDTLTFRITQLDDSPVDATVPNSRWYASSFRHSNEGSGTVSYIHLEPNATIGADRWVLFFVSSNEFQIEGEQHGLLRGEDGAPLRGTSGVPFASANGLSLLLTEGQRPFTAGDTFRFDTRSVATIRATTAFLGAVTLLHSTDTVPPDIQLTVNSQQHFVSGDATDAAPLIGATLTDESGVDFVTRPVTLELGDAAGTYEPIATDAYQLTHAPGSNQLVLTYPSPELQPGEYAIRLTASDVHGNTADARIDFHVYGATQLVSFLNYPNPFARETTLCCELTAPADELEVKIYTLSGRLIRTLETLPTAGFFMLEWDGKDADGVEVANGVYFAKIRIEREGEKEITEILKMMKLR